MSDTDLSEAIIANDNKEVYRLIYLKDSNFDLHKAEDLAIQYGRARILQTIMNRQGGRYLPPSCEGENSISRAAQSGHIDIVKVIVKRMIARRDKIIPSIIKLFIDDASVSLNERDSTCETEDEMDPIEQECAQDCLKYLYQNMTPEEIVATTKMSWKLQSKLIQAVKYHDLKKIDSLIAAGAKTYLRDENGLTPLGLADNVEVAMKLLAAGAKPNI